MTKARVLRVSELVDPTSVVEQIATGYEFTEGPVWMPDGSLWFSDIPADKMCRWHPEDGQSVLRKTNNKGNGMTLDNEGRIIVCEHATSTVARGFGAADRTPVASHWQDRELNSPNDVIVARDGSILFTDPTFGRIRDDVGVVRPLEQEVRGVYRIPASGGSLQLLIDDMAQPNGLCLSPDESLLYVGDTARAHIRAFPMRAETYLDCEGFIFAEGIAAVPAADDGFVDGLKVDELGNVYVTGPGGIWVFSEAGERLGTLDFPEQVANFNWGGPDWKTLYATAQKSVYRLRMKVSGNRLGYMR